MQGPPFLNAVVAGEVDKPAGLAAAAEFCNELRAIEDAFGRDRSLPRFSDRTLDIDLLFYGELINPQGSPQLPRAEIFEHAFVLMPLLDLMPAGHHPACGENLLEVLSQLQQHSQEQFDNLHRLSAGEAGGWPG